MFAGLKQQLQKATASALPKGLQRKEPQPTQRGGRAAKAAPAEKSYGRFIRETKSELKKVTWPTREQATNLTVVVIVVSLAVGLLMGGIDFVFKEFFQLLIRLVSG